MFAQETSRDVMISGQIRGSKGTVVHFLSGPAGALTSSAVIFSGQV